MDGAATYYKSPLVWGFTTLQTNNLCPDVKKEWMVLHLNNGSYSIHRSQLKVHKTTLEVN